MSESESPGGSYLVIDEYLKLLAKPWKESPLELVKTKEDRSTLRSFVDRVRPAYETALKDCGNDSGYLEYISRNRWNYKMYCIFHARGASEEVIAMREKLVASLPCTLKTGNTSMPNDPYVEDKPFFERLFKLRASYKTFNSGDKELQRIYDKYKDLWMKNQLEYKKPLLSEAIHYWLDVFLEKIVSIVTEWKIHGIKSDEDDVWDEEISSDVVPAEVQNSFENDELYENRMFHHDMAKDSLLFYGLPVGARLPSVVPEVQAADYEQAKKDLLEASAQIEEDCFHGLEGMENLGKVANRYLRARAAASS